MGYLPQVVGARYVSGFIVSTRFDDGTEKHIDVSQWFKGPVFEPYFKNPKLFKKFFVDAGTLAWPNQASTILFLKLCMQRAIQKKTPNKANARTRKSPHTILN